ncbi:MAG: MBL fold metallo-hydrolase [Candidatus Staskawiczbacteria bacterium]|nr:MBL fold metallo-hydrolase [Candidatus Staskawiczbacteria bacterium]
MVRRIYAVCIVGLFLLNIFVWREVFELAQNQYLKVSVLDVGQGDSIFIKTPAMHQILIDGGPGPKVLGKLQEAMPFWDRSLDMIVLTHPDADHLAGLLYVLEKYQVVYVMWTGVVRDGQLYQRWLEVLAKAERKGTKIIVANPSQQIISDTVLMTTVNPREDVGGQYFKDSSNELGIVSRLDFGKNSFLFTADIGAPTEKALIENGVDLNVDVLKVGHHGSRFSTSEEFLEVVSPELAVISVGKDNTYGHPTAEVLQRLGKFGINALRTDQYGDIEILSDGNTIYIKK